MPEGITVWTADRVAVLRAHAFGKATPAQIAAMIGVSEEAVRTKASKIGICLTAKSSRTSKPHS